jgi:replicative DNA helicase
MQESIRNEISSITRSPEVERNLLRGLIKHPDVFPTVDLVLQECDFSSDVHYTLYCIVKDCRLNKEEIDPIMLAHRVQSLGITFEDQAIDIFDYIENICYKHVSSEATLQYAQSLIDMRVRRTVIGQCERAISFTKKSGGIKFDEYRSEVDKILYGEMMEFEKDDGPKNVFDGAEESIEEKAKKENQMEDVGLATPFEEFNNFYGGLEPGNVYGVVARPGQGKTTFLNYMAMYTSQINNVPALMLDTEMTYEEIQERIVASMSGVPLWHIKTGNWRRNEEMSKNIRDVWAKIKNLKYDHMHVGNKDIDELVSIARRWHFSEVGRDKPSIICLDYIKLTGEKVGQNWAEYQAIGEKVDKIKRLAIELNCPIFTAMQMNRSGESFNRNSGQVTDDASVIAISDRFTWFASNVFLFRQKTADERALDGERWGTHKLIPVKTRIQGKMAYGHSPYLDRPMPPDGENKPCPFYLNFDIDNFRVTERGSLRHVIEEARENYQLNDNQNNEERSNVSV